MLDLKRQWFKSEENFIGKTLGKLPITPNQWTISSLFVALLGLYFVINFNFLAVFISFLIAGILDFIDGSVARAKNMSTNIGAYLDTFLDRCVEGIMLLGFLFLPLPTIFLPSYVWIFLSLLGSLTTTYAKAAAIEKGLTNKEFKGGLLTRGERIILISIAFIFLIFSQYYYATIVIIVFALLSIFTSFQRFFSAVKRNRII